MRRCCPGSTKKGRHGWLAAATLWLAGLACAPLCIAWCAPLRAAERLPPDDSLATGDAALFPPPPLPLAKGAAAHQLWLVSTRQLPHGPRAAGEFDFEVQRYQQEAGWSAASLEELFAADDDRLVTSVLVHGNHTNRQWAIDKGLAFYRTLVGSARAEQPVRLIVWSWPSDQVPGSFRDDARVKAQRTNIEGYYLAKFLDRLRGPNPVSLAGYSFGARVITGALHLLGGGVLEGRRLGEREQFPRPPLHALLMAAAIDRDWLLPGQPHGRALSSVERMVVFVNPQDRVLRWYRFVSPGQALGSHGLPSRSRLDVDRRRFFEIDVTTAVGNRHGWTNYIGSPAIVKHLQQETLVETMRRAGSRTQAGGG
ncbi:MAG TPA: hypothetical protein VGN42_22195 [Pirellulales bacterium]|nr:hypothetical protein [Pirellulales bacterium]